MPAERLDRGRIQLQQLSVVLGTGASAVEAVRDFDLDVSSGEFLCLLGPSGCGKSTLLGAVAGFLRPASGQVLVDEVPVERPGADRGMVFQQHSLLPWRRVLDNVAFGLKARGVPRRERQAAAAEMLAAVGLAGFERHFPAQLSGGMQQRVELARVLINRPSVILMDEPFGALDAQTRLKMQELLLQIWGRVRTTILFVTHDIDEAIFLGDRVVVLTTRPGVIRAELPVKFARPRAPELLTSSSFLQLRRRCFELLREVPTSAHGYELAVH
jgi:NitT/TauT family transport system ATP-binding protein